MFDFFKKDNTRIKELQNRISAANKAIKIYEGIVDKNVVSFVREQILTPALNFRLKVDSYLKGKEIVNNGMKIINQRDSLHAEILLKEKQGFDVSKEKEQLKAFDWILGEFKNET